MKRRPSTVRTTRLHEIPVILWPCRRHARGDKLRPTFCPDSLDCRLPDSASMSYWRTFFIVVLLALSLPVQSFAAVSTQCAAAQDDAPRHREQAAPEYHRDMQRMARADDAHHPRHHGGAHHAHACSTCASCCIGTGLPAMPAVAVAPDAARVASPIPPPAGVVSFLTDGIERPPRRIPV
ncbi:DUF2946 family protein [Burkholderia ubonensis]|uniref:DUF2946 family protein n=1 Tax=Burkholderia ubonensis TaxID=101571 RepID=UPI001E601505|nr:hypothetical protein [Burkholderia ubonensis]